MLATWHFHIEISSKCTLKCPRCARQEVPDSLINTELDLEFFKRNFTPEFIVANVEKITFCGDDGDPVYAHDLIPVIEYIKSVRPVEIVIITNGSHKKITWWIQLGQLLDHNDSVHFSVDGYDNDSNNLYRVNSDWDTIIAGLQTLRSTSDCQIVWAAIAFKFNEHKLDFMQNFAQRLGADRFQITKSTKFGSIYPSYGANDLLEPTVKFMSSSHRFERTLVAFTEKTTKIPEINIKLYNDVTIQNNIKPLCEIGNKGLYIDARGRLFPCCWVANRYTHNSEWQTLAEQFNLHHRTLTDVVADPFWEGEFKAFKWQECTQKCNKNLVNQEYSTSW